MKRLLGLLSLVAVLLAPPAAFAQPDAAKAKSPRACGYGLFNSLSTLARTAGGSPAREPELRVGPSDSEIDGGGPATSPAFAATIPTYVHVIHNKKTGNVSDAAISQQMAVLNAGFSGAREASGPASDSSSKA